MDTNKLREQFEAWAAKNYVVPPGVGHLFVRAELGDGYRLSNINHAWLGWQASRSGVVVDLPEGMTLNELRYGSKPKPDHARLIMRQAAVTAIEAQGLKVAP